MILERDLGTEEQIIDNAIASAVHSLLCSVSTTTRLLSGAVAFGRDTLVDIPLVANIESI